MKELSVSTQPYQGPIAVYQMGKVGSESIVFSLKRLGIPNDIYHIHVLYPENLKLSIQQRQALNLPLTLQMEHSQALREYLDRGGAEKLRVITAVREPVSQLISSIFQNIQDEHPDFIDAEGNWKLNPIKDFVVRSVLNYDNRAKWQNCNWFDYEFKPALNLDVYQEEFNKRDGYAVLETEGVKVLILQLENSKNWGEIISDFLELKDKLEMVKVNDSEHKAYREAYQKIREEITLPESVLANIYSSQYCQHFYTEEMIDRFIKRWSSSTVNSKM
ncbi:putative capsular polysaccharide synthesis family protein [Capilliphycus salinus ALCB114379]|uniref:putative capsular polysaccharide synthesis family protein n=1 Tax=Capilliphycus salinus TaxID=2768948 RepID=UPI0039A4F722